MPDEKLTQQELERYLWKAANILRGRIDSGEYKHYIFGLLFFKRLSDVWHEEYEERLEVYEDAKLAADPDEHRFHIPEGHFWEDVREKTTDIGAALNDAIHAVQDANLRLQGVFGDVDFNNKERFPDALLEELLQHFDRYSLRNEDVEPDILGNAYEYLIKQFADDAGKKGGEFYTPKMVVRLIVEMLQPDEGMTIYDPTCGSGGMLLESVKYLERNRKNPESLRLYGQEMNLNTWAICQMNLFLHGIDDAFIERGDTLRDPRHLTGGKSLQRFNRVLANPPFSEDEWPRKAWETGDPFGRDAFGCPPQSYGDLAFIQHMIASLKSDGKLGVVVPHGVLYRGGSEASIRQGIVEEDLLEAVIGLGGNLFYGNSIPAVILVLHKDKPISRKNRVLFVYGAEEIQNATPQNFLSEDNVARLAGAYHAWDHEPGFSRPVPLHEIVDNRFDLSIARYVDTADKIERVNVRQQLKRIRGNLATQEEAKDRVLSHLRTIGYDGSEPSTSVRLQGKASVGKVLSGGAMPDEWEMVPLSDIGKWHGGGTPKRSDDQYWGGSIPWASPKDFTSDELWDTQDHITPRALEDSSAKLVPEGGLVMVVRSGILRSRFPVAICRRKLAINQDIKAVHPHSGIVPEFILGLLQLNEEQLLASCRKTGTTVESISSSALMSFKIPVPPLREQQRIAQILSDFRALRNELQRVEEVLASLQVGVMQDLYSGSVRTPDCQE